MTLRLREAGEADRADWTAFVASRPEGDVLQSWAWGRAGAGESDTRCSRLIVVDANGRTRGLAQVLEGRTSLGRAVLDVAHGPLWDRESPDAAEVLARLLTGLRVHAKSRRATVLTLDPRATGDATADAAVVRALRATTQPAAADRREPETRIIDLASPDDPIAAWDENARDQARRADGARIQVQIDRCGDPAALDAFFTLLSAMPDGTGLGGLGRESLGRLAGALAASDDWFLSLAERDGRLLAGAVAARTGDHARQLDAVSSGDAGRAEGGAPYAAMAALQRCLREAGTATFDTRGAREFGGSPLHHLGTFEIIVDPGHGRDLRERLRTILR